MKQLKARPTVYKGIQMRSRLEASYAARLDNNGVVWTYEPCAFGSTKGQYLPDFRLGGSRPFGYVEVKPTLDAAIGLDVPVGRSPSDRMAIIWESEPDALLFLVVDGSIIQGCWELQKDGTLGEWASLASDFPRSWCRP